MPACLPKRKPGPLKLRDVDGRGPQLSLDTLDPEKFLKITRNGCLDDVMTGIKAALSAELHPVKINMVITDDTSLK